MDINQWEQFWPVGNNKSIMHTYVLEKLLFRIEFKRNELLPIDYCIIYSSQVAFLYV